MVNSFCKTNAQRNAIMHSTGPAVVVAGPGSGKTFVITERIKYLIQVRGINPAKILVITFTKAAATQMQQRFYENMGSTRSVTFKTFHALFYGIICQYANDSIQEIISQTEKKEILQYANACKDKSKVICEEEMQDILSYISRRKNTQGTLGYLDENKEYAYFFSIYEKEKEKRNKVDFEDLVIVCKNLLEKEMEITTVLQERYGYILVDEFQDITPNQYKILRLLGGEQANIFIVGDEDQSIYRFCGSRMDSMQIFMKDYPKATLYKLEINFRGSKSIVQISQQLIQCNPKRLPKRSVPYKNKEGTIEVIGVSNLEKEIDFLVKKIKENPWKSKAIIGRTKEGLMHIIERLIEEEIYFTSDIVFSKGWQLTIFKDIMTYIRLSRDGVSKDGFFQIMNKPDRILEKKAFREEIINLEKALNYYEGYPIRQKNLLCFFQQIEAIKKMTIFGAIFYIRKGIGYESYLEALDKKSKRKGKRWIKILNEMQEASKKWDTLADMEQALNNKENKYWKNKSNVNVVTMHGAKGLEYDEVYIMDVNEGIIPFIRAKDKVELEEERRLLYVAMTRAKEELYFLFIYENEGNKKKISRFLKEIEDTKDKKPK